MCGEMKWQTNWQHRHTPRGLRHRHSPRQESPAEATIGFSTWNSRRMVVIEERGMQVISNSTSSQLQACAAQTKMVLTDPKSSVLRKVNFTPT